jgi:hypothetical protein
MQGVGPSSKFTSLITVMFLLGLLAGVAHGGRQRNAP